MGEEGKTGRDAKTWPSVAEDETETSISRQLTSPTTPSPPSLTCAHVPLILDPTLPFSSPSLTSRAIIIKRELLGWTNHGQDPSTVRLTARLGASLHGLKSLKARDHPSDIED
jgi:hypothetical protein